MAARSERTPLSGSERAAIPGSQAVAPANPEEIIQVSLRVKTRNPLNPAELHQNGNLSIGDRRPLSREDYEKNHGAHPDDLSKVEQFARDNRLSVVESDPARRAVILRGTVAAFSSAFNVELKQYEHEGRRFRGRTGAIHIPTELEGIITGVFGLDDRPQAKPHFRRREEGVRGARATGVSYTPIEVAEAYDFPANTTGKGQTIALIELGGGYKTSDLKSYFQKIGVPEPKVHSVDVDGAKNAPTGDPNSADGEVALDIEVAGAIAPGAKIVTYFAPNTDAGFLDAITKAVHDRTHHPSTISISWGGPESSWTQQSLTAFDEAFQAAAAMGVSVCAASGDNGSSDGLNDGNEHVDFPASDPFVLACGGTNLDLSGKTPVETVWNDGANGGATGGGISDVFALPNYQQNARIPKSVNDGKVRRGVPDVAADADPATGYQILVDGQQGVFGGTSAVAPLMAALIARINEQSQSLAGFINPVLYNQAETAGALRDVTEGDNGAYRAGPGWDACTGLGSPNGTSLAGALNSKQTAQRVTPPEKRAAAS